MSEQYKLYRLRAKELPVNAFGYGNPWGTHLFTIRKTTENGDTYDSCPKQIMPSELRAEVKYELMLLNKQIALG